MRADLDVMWHLVLALVSSSLLISCSHYANYSQTPPTVVDTVRWGSVLTLLAAAYYVLWQVWPQCGRRKRGYSRTRGDGAASSASPSFAPPYPLPETHEADIAVEGLEPGMEVQAGMVLYPELTVGSVWLYVYAWGLLLFVCVYCLSGLELTISCWWALGLLAVVMDELIQSGMRKEWVVLLLTCLLGCMVSLWFGAHGESAGLDRLDYESKSWHESSAKQSDEALFGQFLMGVVCPVATPFIFFSLRTSASGMRDVSRLCGLALPFMVVLALCVLMGTTYAPPVRRQLWFETGESKSVHNLLQAYGSPVDGGNGTYTETQARFYATAVKGDGLTSAAQMEYLQYVCMLGSPVICALTVRQLILAVLEGFSTEFLAAFLLVLSSRYCVTHDYGGWGVVCMSLASVGFVVVLLVRRVL